MTNSQSRNPQVWKFSRSHDQTAIDCPRMAYLEYYYEGTGIVKRSLDLFRATGSLTHDMLREVMIIAKTTGGVPFADNMSRLCDRAIRRYKEDVHEHGFEQVSGEVEIEIERQSALAEGLTRAWTRMRLPYILEHYNIIAVEEEHEIPFRAGQVLMSRLDGVLERKEDGELLAGPEFKTTGWISEDYMESWRYSTQTLSHCFDVREVHGRMPLGIAMEFLYKGMKKRKEGESNYTYYSPLVRAFKMTDGMGEVTYGYDSSLARKKDWTPFDTSIIGMEKWIDQLPDDILEKMLFNQVVYRSEAELEMWRLQVSMRQARIQAGLQLLSQEPTQEAADEIMATVFPARLDQFCYRNQYKKSCPYLDICYGKIDSPLESGIFVRREPHHPQEFADED